jgi:hypothetical protein
MGLFTRKIKIEIEVPPPSRYDRFSDAQLYDLVEQALGSAEANFRVIPVSDETAQAHMAYCATALEDALGGVKALLRRRMALAQNL